MASGQTKIKMVLSAKASRDRLSEKPPLAFVPAKEFDGPSVLIDPRPRFQTIEGFGGAFTESAAVVLKTLPPAQRLQVLREYFDPKKGIGYNVGRVPMNSSDFSIGNWACDDVPGDVQLKHFSIERDRQATIPMIKAAQKIADGKIKLFASPWSPPAWMKTNGEMNHGGKLKPQYRRVWANYYCRFFKEFAGEGIKFWGLTVQNEPEANQPFDSCIWSGAEERDFVRDHLGPALHKAGLSYLKLMIWDHNRDIMVERAKAVYDDPRASKYVWGTAFHWYNGDHFENVRKVHDAWPDKKLFFTEGCVRMDPKADQWEIGERYAKSIIKDLNNWATGWTDWNMILDINGGPRHVPGPLSAPILIDSLHKKAIKVSSFYYMGHFSKFIRPGAVRIMAAASKEELESTAFLNTDGTIAAVIMNRSAKAIRFALKYEGKMSMVKLPARAITTLLFPAGRR